jgi:AcrR family transcriptional regulator
MAERLSQERILEVAGRLAREDGLEALSMRRIAQQLDVWPMSLYRHFRDKDELLDALAAGAAPPARAPAASGGDWREEVRAVAGQIRAVVAEQPTGLGERLPRVLDAPALRELDTRAEAALARGGARDAAAAWRAIATYAFGSAARGEADPEFETGLELLLAGVTLGAAAAS